MPNLVIEVAPLAAPVASPTSLPPAPIIVGKLSSASAALPAPEPTTASVRASGFSNSTTASSTAPNSTLRTSSFQSAKAAAEPAADRAPVAKSGFGDASASLPAASPSASARPATVTAVEILDKPKPVYTEEARLLRIEGDVTLEVLFSASGETRVLRVIDGLGHGLDEAARASAARIQFRPARRSGSPVDQIATVRIVFRLAY